MGSTKRKFTQEFKQEACRLVLDQGQSITQTAKNLDVHISVLARWLRNYRKNGVGAFPGSGRLPPQEAEIRRLQRELARVTEEREILKKAITFFRSHER